MRVPLGAQLAHAARRGHGRGATHSEDRPSHGCEQTLHVSILVVTHTWGPYCNTASRFFHRTNHGKRMNTEDGIFREE